MVEQRLAGPIIRVSIMTMILGGLLYPLATTGISKLLMPERANGSLIYENGHPVGSALIGQNVQDPALFHGRVSAIEYDAAASGSNNYAPSNPELIKRVEGTLQEWKKENPSVPLNQVPMDLMTDSGSGLDPHISPEAALAQVDRIAEATSISKSRLKELIVDHTEGKEWGFLGERRVNVLLLNLALKKE